jgi:hypothetical protein
MQFYAGGWFLSQKAERFACDAETLRQALTRPGMQRMPCERT